MKRLLAITAVAFVMVLAVACDSAPPPKQQPAQAGAAPIQTIETVVPRPAQLDPPPVLQDEAPPPKPKTTETQTAALSPEDERMRAALPFAPAIAMDPIDGSKISIRATTPTFEYKGKIYYFSNETNKRLFLSDPEHALKGGFMKL